MCAHEPCRGSESDAFGRLMRSQCRSNCLDRAGNLVGRRLGEEGAGHPGAAKEIDGFVHGSGTAEED